MITDARPQVLSADPLSGFIWCNADVKHRASLILEAVPHRNTGRNLFEEEGINPW
jgi:hypothetical protein